MSETEFSLVRQSVKLKNRLELWVIVNAILSCILIIGQMFILGSMQQVYTRLNQFQASHNEYVKMFKEKKDSDKAPQVVLKQQSVVK